MIKNSAADVAILNPQRVQRRVHFINRYYRPDHSATAQLLTDTAEFLAASGIETRVVTSRQLYENAQADLSPSETLDRVLVRRVAASRFGRRGIAGRALDYASFAVAVLADLLANVRPGDIIIAKTDPPMLGTIAALAGRWRGAINVNWLQDIFPDVAFAAGLRIPSLLRKPLIRARDFALRRATVNVAIGELMADRVRTVTARASVRVIHNWAPFAHIHPVERERNHVREAWSLQGKFVVGYSGNMGRAHDFETILSAARALKADEDTIFLLIGGGAQQELIRRQIEELELGNVVLKPYQPAELLAETLSAADVHIVSLRPELEGLIVPSKFYGVLAAGRPVLFIGDPEGELAQLIRRHDCGFAIAQGDHAALEAVIRRLSTEADTLARVGNNAVQAAGIFGRAHGLAAWQSLIRELLDS